MIKLSKIDTPKSFYRAIPKDLEANKAFRKELHLKILADDKSAQNVYLYLCGEYLPIMFSSMFWTYNPQAPRGQRDIPFILWEKQVQVVDELDKALKAQAYDFGIEKTRKQGATEIVAQTFAGHMILFKDSSFILGSRKKEYVDSLGVRDTIFAKIDHLFETLPPWMIDFKKSAEKGRKDMTLVLDITNSVAKGETTNENFSAGGRSTGMFLDEFGRVQKRIAESIEGSVHDVCNCIVYGSTHWYGPQHTFNQVLSKDTTKVMSLYWYEHNLPHDEVNGIYRTPEPGVVELIDVDYYRDRYPELLEYAI